MERLEYSMDPFAGVDDDAANTVLGIIDENSAEDLSDDEQIIHLQQTNNTSDIEVKNQSNKFTNDKNIVTYRVIHMNDNNTIIPPAVNLTSSSSQLSTSSILPSATSNSSINFGSLNTQQYYVIGSNSLVGLPPLKPLTSTPGTTTTTKSKLTSNITIGGAGTGGVVRNVIKRDERRRATHNEVERRRRDKINHLILQLANTIPIDGETGRISQTNSEGQSKGEILSKACEYIQLLQENNSRLSECLKDNEVNLLENQELKQIVKKLTKENDELRKHIEQHGIPFVKSEAEQVMNETESLT